MGVELEIFTSPISWTCHVGVQRLLLLERNQLCQTQFSVHLPVWQPHHLLYHHHDVLQLQRGLGTQQRLARGTIGQDEDDQQEEEAEQLRQHVEQDDNLGSKPEADVEYSQDAEVNDHVIGCKHNSSHTEG